MDKESHSAPTVIQVKERDKKTEQKIGVPRSRHREAEYDRKHKQISNMDVKCYYEYICMYFI